MGGLLEKQTKKVIISRSVTHMESKACEVDYLNRLEIPEDCCGKSCNAGHLRKTEGRRPYRLRHKKLERLQAPKNHKLIASHLFLGMLAHFLSHHVLLKLVQL